MILPLTRFDIHRSAFSFRDSTQHDILLAILHQPEFDHLAFAVATAPHEL